MSSSSCVTVVKSSLKQGIVLGSLGIEMSINQSQLSQPWEEQADKKDAIESDDC